MGLCEPHEIQHSQVQGAALVSEQSEAQVQAGERMGGEQPWGAQRLAGAGSQAAQHTQQCALPAQKAHHALGYIKRSVGSRSREVILPLYSTLKKYHLQFIKLWGLPHKKEVDLLQQIQRRSKRLTQRAEHLSYEDRLKTGVIQPGEEKAPNTSTKPFST